MIDKNALYGALNEGIVRERMACFRWNLERNIPYIRRYGGVRRIVHRFRGKHAIIVGAGPSLERNLALLKKYHGRREFVVAAADMALKPLSAAGIVPGYVFSCETVPVDYFGGVDTGAMHLVAFSCMSHINLRKWGGDVSFYNWLLRAGDYDGLWERAGTDLGFVATGNIISTQAVSFALGCGIASLILVGNDLGFSDTVYAGETEARRAVLRRTDRTLTAESAEFGSSRDRREYQVKRGDRVFYTNSQFLAAKLWLEDLFGKTPVAVYDCSEPGCSEKSVRRVSLKEYFSGFDRKSRGRRR